VLLQGDKAAQPCVACCFGCRTFCGYSALRMAMRLKKDAHIFSVEPNAQCAAIAQALLEYAGVADRVTIVHGKSSSVIPDLCSHGEF
jgi:predicted O-methyltransferase YrrM